MIDRRKSLRLAITHTIIVAVVVLLAVGATWFLTRREVQKLDAELATLDTQASAMREKRDELPLIKEALPELTREAGTISKMFPLDSGDRELIEFLEGELARSRAELVSWQLTAPKQFEAGTKGKGQKSELEERLDKELLEKTQVLTFTMEVRSRFAGIIGFLEGLKQSGRYIRITGVSSEDVKTLEEPGLRSWRLSGDMFFITEQKDLSQQFADLRQILASVMGYKPEFEEPAAEAEAAAAAEESTASDEEPEAVPAAADGGGSSTSAEAHEEGK